MLFRGIKAVYSENYNGNVNELCGQNGALLLLKQVVNIVTIVL
jgi:hypothetical protein